MVGHLFVTQGDLAHIQADVLVYTTDRFLQAGFLWHAFQQRYPDFCRWFSTQPLPEVGRDYPVGKTFWYQPPNQKDPLILVVVVTDDGPDPAGQTRTAVRSALAEAVRRVSDGVSGGERQPLVALPAVNVGLGAGPRAQTELAAVQVNEGVAVLRETGAVCDVAFVLYTPALHQIFRQARRAVMASDSGRPVPPSNLIEGLAAEEAVLFAGAGLSVPAGLPSWGQLIDELIGKSDRPRTAEELLSAAQKYREQPGGASRLADYLRSRFAGARPTLAHYLLLTLPIRAIITTNYDPLLEDTLRALKRSPAVVVREQDVTQTGAANGVYVVKFHGDASTPDDIVLCRQDYEEFFRTRPALSTLLRGLLLNQHFVFIGYSLRDPNFQQIFGEVAAMLRDAQRPAFATTFEQTGESPAWLPEGDPLTLVSISGTNLAEQQRSFLLWLDELLEQVLAESPAPFLAPDAVSSPGMATIRSKLMEVGRDVERACQRPEADDVPLLAHFLDYLTDHGWRPERAYLCDLWRKLATSASSSLTRRRCLASSLRHAETASQKQVVLSLLGGEAAPQ